MIESFRAEALQTLLADGEGPHLSLYLPTHRRHPEWKQDPVRFRALLGEAQELLSTRYKTRDVDAFLERAKSYGTRGLVRFVRDMTEHWSGSESHEEGRVE